MWRGVYLSREQRQRALRRSRVLLLRQRGRGLKSEQKLWLASAPITHAVGPLKPCLGAAQKPLLDCD
jgi:hypothetical protein